jgi:F420-non-reducing hydrogenase iron-sulfur subunit
VGRAQELLEQIGLEPQRVRMFNMSSAMAGGFAEAAREMTEQISELGRNPLRRQAQININPETEE